MCGRYTLTRAGERELAERFEIAAFGEMQLGARFNIAPSQQVPVIVQENGQRVLALFKWGLIPSWVKDLNRNKPMINARIETIAEKPFFKAALRNRRCLIPSDGFFEWRADAETGKKVPTYIYFVGNPLFAFAGLWDQWITADGEVVRTCSIITEPANSFMTQIHNRMPAIIPAANEAKWLNPAEADLPRLLSLLVAPAENELACHPVSTLVNSPRHDSQSCIALAR